MTVWMVLLSLLVLPLLAKKLPGALCGVVIDKNIAFCESCL